MPIERLLQRVRERLQAPGDDGQDLEHDLRVATAALLFEVCRADDTMDRRESEVIAEKVRRAYELEPAEMDELLALARGEAEEAISLHQFTSLIHRHCDEATKRQLIEDVWSVALADETIDAHEEHLIRRVADLLYVSHGDLIQAKHRAQRGRDEQ